MYVRETGSLKKGGRILSAKRKDWFLLKLENGYRYFSQGDVEKLKKIALLRKFDLSIEEISKSFMQPIT